MYVDKKLTLHDGIFNATFDTERDSTHDVDLGEGYRLQDTPLNVLIKIDTAVTSAGGATILFKIETAATVAALTATPIVIWTSTDPDDGTQLAIPKATLVADYVVCDAKLPAARTLRFVRVSYFVGTADLTAGSMLATVYPTGEHQTNKNHWIS